MRILAYDPYVSQDAADAVGVTMTSLEELVRQSDFISLHAHVTEQTQALLGRREFDMMKPSAYLINTARAALVDETALMQSLQENRIAGAALDVFHKEPLPPDHPLLKLPNVLALPHIGGATLDVIRHQSETAERNLEAIREGRIPPTLVNRDVLNSPKLRLPRPSDAQ
jgi:phosphoglycerate dehydrogenase-like enzyme